MTGRELSLVEQLTARGIAALTVLSLSAATSIAWVLM